MASRGRRGAALRREMDAGVGGQLPVPPVQEVPQPLGVPVPLPPPQEGAPAPQAPPPPPPPLVDYGIFMQGLVQAMQTQAQTQAALQAQVQAQVSGNFIIQFD